MSNIPTSLSEVRLTLFRLTMSIADPCPIPKLFLTLTKPFQSFFQKNRDRETQRPKPSSFLTLSPLPDTIHEKDKRLQDRETACPDLQMVHPQSSEPMWVSSPDASRIILQVKAFLQAHQLGSPLDKRSEIYMLSKTRVGLCTHWSRPNQRKTD